MSNVLIRIDGEVHVAASLLFRAFADKEHIESVGIVYEESSVEDAVFVTCYDDAMKELQACDMVHVLFVNKKTKEKELMLVVNELDGGDCVADYTAGGWIASNWQDIYERGNL